jgi:hypothetical protein
MLGLVTLVPPATELIVMLKDEPYTWNTSNGQGY